MSTKKLNIVSLGDSNITKKSGTAVGEGVVIKNQNKEVSIVENGIIEVFPDEGFTGLSKVQADVNVPLNAQEKTIEITETSYSKTIYPDSGYSVFSKVIVNANATYNLEEKTVDRSTLAERVIKTSSGYQGMSKVIINQAIVTQYCGFEIEVKYGTAKGYSVVASAPFKTTWENTINNYGTYEGLDSFILDDLSGNISFVDKYGSITTFDCKGYDTVESTKYVVSFPSFYTATINGVTYRADANTLWKNWITSSYNTGGFTIDDNGYVKVGDNYLIQQSIRIVDDTKYVTSDMVFCHNGAYSFADIIPAPDADKILVSGLDRIEINSAKVNSIESLKVNGGAEQNGTPVPTAPVHILTNKGALRYANPTNNLLEVNDENIVVGSYINNNGAVTASAPNMYFQRFVAVKANAPYTLSTSEHINYANFMEYDANGVFIKRTLYGSTSAYVGTSVTHTMGDTTAFVIIGSNIDSAAFPTVTKENVKSIKWMFNEGDTALPYEEYVGGFVTDGKDEIIVANDDFLPSGYTALEYIESDGKSGYVDTGIVIDAIHVDVEVDVQFNDISASSPEMAWGYMDNTSNIPRWGLGIYSSKWLGSPNATNPAETLDTNRHNIVLRVYEKEGESFYSGTIDGESLYGEAPLSATEQFINNTLPIYLFARNNRGVAGNFGNCKIYGFKVTQDGVLIHDLVPCKNNEDVLGFYDVIAQAFYAGVGTLAGGDTKYNVISKASAEMLLSVGSYADVQDLISGVVTRNVGIRVFDGSESSWYLSMSGEVYRYRYKFDEEDNAYYKSGRGTDMLCTHFKVLTSGSTAGGTFLNGSSNSEYLFMIPDQSITTLEGFRQWLQMQYAKGTPVIVLYPLAEDTKETVQAQPLSNSNGNFIIARTAEIDGLRMEAILDNEPDIKFFVDNSVYKAKEGMTWENWINSSLCPTGIFSIGDSAVYKENKMIRLYDTSYSRLYDIIGKDFRYHT